MLPEFPIAKKVLQKSQQDFFENAQKGHLGSLFGNIPKRIMPEGNKLKQVYSPTMETETDLTEIKSSFNLSVDEIKKNPFIIYEKLLEMAKDFADQHMMMTVKSIQKVTALTGNVVNTKNGFTVESFYECLEKVEIPFDENGKPIIPAIVGGPQFIDDMIAELKKHEHLPESKQRMDEIIKNKRKQWNDREDSRKLVD